MRGGGRGVAGGNTRLLATLAMVEIAIAVIVVSGAGLFLRTLDRLSQVDPGFHADRVLTMRVSLPLSRYPTPAQALAFYQAAQPEIESLPGVRSASFGGSLPLTGFDIGQGVQIVGDANRGGPLAERSLSDRGRALFRNPRHSAPGRPRLHRARRRRVAAGGHRQPGIRAPIPQRPTGRSARTSACMPWIPPDPGLSIAKSSAWPGR